MKLPFFHNLKRVFLPFCLFLLFTLSNLPAEIVSEEISEPFPGIRILERVTNSPPQRIYAAFIQVSSPFHYVDATAPTRTLQSVEEWAEENNALVAVNGDFYQWNDGALHLQGDAVGNGEHWPEAYTARGDQYADDWYHHAYGWIAFGGNGATFTHSRHTKKSKNVTTGWKPDQIAPEIPKNTRALVSGYSQLVIDGEAVFCEDPTAKPCFPDRGDMRDARHPRTAMGLTRDHGTFILVVVDGRVPGKATGMYGTELAALMKEFGAWNAFNIDGGASAQFYVKGRGTINAPQISKRRTVLNHWGVFPKEKTAQ